MKSELIVDVHPDRTLIALTEDDRLMEWGQENHTEATFSVGNIYYGRVKKIMPALNAAFVDVGHEKEAFLHYLDLGSQFLTLEKFTNAAVQNRGRKPSMLKTPGQKEVGKQGSVADILKVGQEILVQVTKEPINTKGPRLTAEISLAGRNIVLIPFGDKVMVSNKIKSDKERNRLKQMMQQIRPERFGIIVRTVAEGKRLAELDAELRSLMKRWDDAVARLQRVKPVSLVAEETSRTLGIIRDVFTPNFTSIQVNDREAYEEIREYVSTIAPDSEKIVHLYQGDQPILDYFQITRQMKTGLGRTVGFKNGGYLIMERTEALYSIDVNSGSRKQGLDQEENAFNCNMLAADEIYHQLRLRDIGGIIIVDFIDMDSAEHRQLLFEHMRQLLKRDRARHNVLQLSKFGLMQITRQRVRPVAEMDVEENCPTCGGKGKIQPSILFTDSLDEQVEWFTSHFGKGLKLYVHPYVYAYAVQGFFFRSIRFRWWMKYGVKLLADESLPMLEYRFVNKNGEELKMPRLSEESTLDKADKKASLYTVKPIEEKPEVNLAKEEKDTPATEETPVAPKKKKRRRKKKNNSSEAEVQQQEQVVATATVSEPEVEPAPEPKKEKKSRTSKQSKPQEVVEEKNASPDKPEVPAEVVDEAPKPKRKRSARKKANATPAAQEETPVAAKEQDIQPVVATEETKPKKRATRKKAVSKEAPTPEVIVEAPAVAEDKVTEEKPKKKRAPRKKAVKPAETTKESATAATPNPNKQEA